MRYVSRQTFALWTVAFVLFSIVAATGATYSADFGLVRAFQRGASESLDALGGFFSTIGGWELTSVFLVLLTGSMAWRGHWRLAAWIVGVFLATALLEYLLKSYLPVPPIPDSLGRTEGFAPTLEIEYGYPYPSGHVLRSTILLGALYLWSERRWVGVSSVLLLLGMSLTRIYLGVHWPSDVIGGFLLGAAAVALVFARPAKVKEKT
jgi:undecaprenyl-diphosphatase